MQKGSDTQELFTNIQQARLHLHRLKQEAQDLQADPYNSANHNMRDYIKNVAYSLTKNEQAIDKKCLEYKQKLPNINKQEKVEKIQENASVLNGYKKYKKNLKPVQSKRVSDNSTKAENSFSFSVQNRPMKIHSINERNIRADVSVGDIPISQMEIPAQFLKLKQQATKLQQTILSKRDRQLSHHIRKASSQKKRRINYIDMNKSSIIKDEHVLNPPTSSEYNSIIDRYSKHQFMIINGKIADDSPEYQSYARIYQSIIFRIKEEITKLENYLIEKNVRFARFDGKKLAYLCLQENIRKQELIDCLIDENNQLKELLLPASKYTGKSGREKAVVKLQSFFRMRVLRERYEMLRRKTVTIQEFFRKNLRKFELQRRIHARNTLILENFESRQEQLKEEWKMIKKSKHVEIHLNSIDADEEKRLSIENFAERQNIQLSRIFRLKDQNLIILYVSSSELAPELINYYYRMLELANIPKYQDRLIFFTPSSAEIFPRHFSVSKLLYYSSKTLRQLKVITEDLPTIMIPGQPSNQLIKICDHLNCYLFGGSPQKTKPFTTRSQTIRFLKNLSIECLPSAMQMYDYGEFLNTFSVLIMKNPEVKCWVLKIDDEFAGRGIATLEIGKSKIVQSLLRKIEQKQQSEFFATDPQDAALEPKNQEITIRIRDYLRENLPERLAIATPKVYRCYEEFMGRFIKKGGIIQAKPPMENSKSMLTSPSISFCLEPTGEHYIVCTYDKLLGSPFRCFASNFPQKTMDMKCSNAIIQKMCESFKLRKIFGFFTVDFLCYHPYGLNSKESENRQRLWVIDIDPYINNHTSSFYLFDVLMGGTFFPERNLYLIERDEQKQQTFSVDTMASQGNSLKSVAERTFTFLPHLFNPNMFKITIKQFFKQARIERFNFDVGNREGLCILLLDQLTSGTMSMMAISRSESESIHLLKKFTELIVRISSVKNVDYGHSESEPSTDRISIKDVLSMFIGIVRKDERTNAKQKAIKQHLNNCDLQFLN